MPRKKPATAAHVRIGIDTGGTFTDFVRLGPEGLVVHKLRSTPDDPSRSILEGVAALIADASAALDSPGISIAPASPRATAGRTAVPATEIVHGSTVATNAVLERKGARVGLVVNAGFEDVIRIARQTRPELYNLFVAPPRPIVDEGLTFGIPGRLDFAGQEIEPLEVSSFASLDRALRQRQAEIAAICLLHSYANPAHERELASFFRARGWLVSASHEILPEYREYERWSTTVVNAYVAPLIDRYLGRLETHLSKTLGITRLSIMQSNGGSISAAAARAQAVRTVLSGPAAGVVGAREVARAAGFPRIISFDMGGTSTDVSLVDDKIATTTESKIGDFPVRLPIIDIHTVGAGGGSIARIDTGGALRVGPESAGSNPGPACYGAGDEKDLALTVTDANLLLGRLDPDFFLGGRMKLDAARARRAAAPLARALKLSVEAFAEGVIRVANANMERAIRVVSVERGHDPRRFALVAFGGAGGMHACEIAARLGITTVLIPRHAGVLSALGMLLADAVRDYSASILRPASEISIRDLEHALAPLIAQANRELAAEGFAPKRRAIERSIDVRYIGQSYEITLPFAPNYRPAFDREHARLYGYSNPARATEVVAVRVRAAGQTEKPNLPYQNPTRATRPKPAAQRPARFNGKVTRIPFYHWPDLNPGAAAQGPAIITAPEATAIIPPAFAFKIDGFGNIIASQRPGRAPDSN